MVAESKREFEIGEEPQMKMHKKRMENMGYLVWTEYKDDGYIVHAELERDPYQYKPRSKDYDKYKKTMFAKLTGKNPRE